jgi:integrase
MRRGHEDCRVPDDPPARGAVTRTARTRAFGFRRFIFLTQDGNTPNPSHLRQPLQALCEVAGVPIINIHRSRHAAAALAFRATGDPCAVQRRLGHANVQVTVAVYGYGTRGDQEVADEVGKLLDLAAPQSMA